jgi:hypothetical protein
MRVRLWAAVALAGLAVTGARPSAAVAAPVIAAAGDIACPPGVRPTRDSCRQARTARLVVGHRRIKAVLPLGDEQYPDGSLRDFLAVYARTWGRAFRKTYPVPGNHEYNVPRAAGYFGYFGARALARRKSWYSYRVGRWHLIALNANCRNIGGCGTNAPQTTWLQRDLIRHHPACTLAYWHQARFSTGADHGNLGAYDTWWRILYRHHVDVVLSAHDHLYERYALQTPKKVHDRRRGIREFVVGTGGASLDAFRGSPPNLQVRQNTHFGVLKLTLHHRRYNWRFVTAGHRILDRGSTRCH